MVASKAISCFKILNASMETRGAFVLGVNVAHEMFEQNRVNTQVTSLRTRLVCVVGST